MARYDYGNPIDWPTDVPHGKVVFTDQREGVLVSVGRRSARGGVKHLGVFTPQELTAITDALVAKSKIRQIRSA